MNQLQPYTSPVCTTLYPINTATPFMEIPGILQTHALYALPQIVDDTTRIAALTICLDPTHRTMPFVDPRQNMKNVICKTVSDFAEVVSEISQTIGPKFLPPLCENESFETYSKEFLEAEDKHGFKDKMYAKRDEVSKALNPEQKEKVAQLIVNPSKPDTLLSSTSKHVSNLIYWPSQIAQNIFHIQIVQWFGQTLLTSWQRTAAVINNLTNRLFNVANVASLATPNAEETWLTSLGHGLEAFETVVYEGGRMALTANKLKTIATYTGINSVAKVLASLENAANANYAEPEVVRAVEIEKFVKWLDTIELPEKTHQPDVSLLYQNQTAALDICPIQS